VDVKLWHLALVAFAIGLATGFQLAVIVKGRETAEAMWQVKEATQTLRECSEVLKERNAR